MAAPKCIFCDSDLGPDTKPEHILLNALGGRKTTRRVNCSACNNDFGGTIDDALTQHVEVLRNLLQLESGTGRPPPMLRNVQAGPEKLNFGQDGRPEITAPPFTVTPLPGGRFDVQVMVGSEEALQRILPHLAAKIGMSVSDLIAQMKPGKVALVERRPAGVHHAFSLGGDDALRSVVKSCLVLLADTVGNDEIKFAPFAEAREFVRNGGAEFSKARIQIDSRDVPGLDDLRAGFGPFFNLLYVRSDPAGRVIGHFTLYNTIGWQVVLAEAGGPPDLKIALVSNPLDPPVWTDHATELPDIPFGWLDVVDREYEVERTKECLVRMMQHQRDQSLDAEVDRIVKDVFDRHGIEGEQPVSDPEVKRAVINEIAARLAAHALRLPHERKLGPEEIDKLLQPKATK